MSSDEDDIKDIDVLIVGGGLSGIISSYKINEKAPSLNVVICEATEHIGGQLKNTKLGDIGARWVTKDQYHMYDLCQKLELKLIRRAFIAEDRFLRCWEIDKGILSSIIKFELSRFINDIDLKSVNRLKSGWSDYTRTVEDYIKSKLFFEKSRAFLRIIIRIICGAEASKILLTEFLSICHGCEGFSKLINLLTGQSKDIYEFSAQEFLEKIINLIESVRIATNTRIIEISHDENTSKIVVRDQHDNIFQCSVIILAIPWHEIVKISFQPELPFDVSSQFAENRNYITSFLIKYDKSYWRRNHYSGSFFSHNPPIIGYEIKSGLYGGMILHDGDIENNNTDIKSIVLFTLAEHFGQKMMIPSEWSENTFVQHRLSNSPQIEPWNRVIWSSTDNATSFRGFLSGAVQCGYRAAVDALLILRPQNVNWEDIAEIQRANAIRVRNSWYDLMISSVNVYDSIFFGFVSIVLVSGYLLKNKIFAIIFG